MALKPAAMTWEEAAIVPYGAIMALPLLKNVNLQPGGQKVLINGAYRWDWFCGGADCQTLWSRGDRCLWHPALGLREIPGGR